MSIEEQVNQNIAILFNLSVLGRSFYGIHYQWMRVLGQPHVFQALLAINAKLCELMNNGIIVYPQPELIFQSLKYSYGPAFIKCVILVQDPYHSGQAMGLCLSSMQPGPVPLSLHYVLKAIHSLENNPYNRRTANGDLTYLANEGVLLLNCALTVEAGSPGSHLGMYKAVTDAILKAVNEASPCCAFLCWGNYAKAACNMLRQYPNANARHLYLDAYHPIAWHMYQHAHSGALHMQAANYWLVQHNYPPVNWMAASM